MSIEAMKLALEALEFVNQTGDTQTFDMCYADKAITTIKEALAHLEQENLKLSNSTGLEQPEQLEGLKLIHKADIDLAKKRALEAQPEQEPVAWSPEDTAHRAGGLPMAQPEREPVAWMNNKDFEPIRVRIMQEAYELADRNDSEGYNAIKVMCGDVQRMLPPQPKEPEQEPVAVVTGVYGGRFIVEPTNSAMVLPVNMALYAHPQPRKPLTDEQIGEIGRKYEKFDNQGNEFFARWGFARAIEAAHGIKETEK